jgi:hypothetical protein
VRGSTRNLGKGNPLRVPRCIPSGSWRIFSASSLSCAIQTFRRLITRGRLRSPCTHRSKGVSPPLETPLAGHGDFPLHRHRTMEKRPPFRRAQGRTFVPLPENPPTPTLSPLDRARKVCAAFGICTRHSRLKTIKSKTRLRGGFPERRYEYINRRCAAFWAVPHIFRHLISREFAVTMKTMPFIGKLREQGMARTPLRIWLR